MHSFHAVYIHIYLYILILLYLFIYIYIVVIIPVLSFTYTNICKIQHWKNNNDQRYRSPLGVIGAKLKAP